MAGELWLFWRENVGCFGGKAKAIQGSFWGASERPFRVKCEVSLHFIGVISGVEIRNFIASRHTFCSWPVFVWVCVCVCVCVCVRVLFRCLFFFFFFFFFFWGGGGGGGGGVWGFVVCGG